MAIKLLARHDAASHTRYQELKQLARSQRRLLPGAPGTLKQRARRGTDYWVREYLRADGRKDDEHIGTVANVDPARIKGLQAEIDLAKALVSGSSTLRLFGYQRVERKTAAVLAALFNHGLFHAGLTLVGSHAYGALLNEIGIIAAGYATQDIDVARAQPLSIAAPDEMDFRQLLNESGLDKLPGGETPALHLLIPGKVIGKVLPVKESGAHAQSIPLLDFLVKDPLEAIVLGPTHVVPVKVPAPERFVLHKLYASQSRKADRDKVRQDLQQAAVITAGLAEDAPGSLEDVLRTMPADGRVATRRGARAAAKLLADSHAAAREALERMAGR